MDERLLDRWTRGQLARARARRALPPKWLNDPRPEMRQVCEVYVELLARELSRRPARASRRAAT